MEAAYVEGDRAIYVETRVGSTKPEVYRQAFPSDPANEMDVLMLNTEGSVLYAVRGGDEYIDSSWVDRIGEATAGEDDPVQRADDFRLAQRAAIALGAVLPVGFADHAFHMASLGKMIPAVDDPDMQMRAYKIDQARADVGYSAYNPGGSFYLETDLYHASTGCFAWICTAKHSGTVMWVYKTSWVQAQMACNHGRCPGNLNYKCYSAGGWYSSGGVNGETNVNSTSVSGGCSTSYNWNSGGHDHLCNDDAAYELWQAKGNLGLNGSGRPRTTYGDNTTFSWNNTGEFNCDCNATGCDNDWNSPNCP